MHLEIITNPLSSLPKNPTRGRSLMASQSRAGRVDPFRSERRRECLLRPLKKALVALGRSGSRRDFELIQRVFIEIPGLRSS